MKFKESVYRHKIYRKRDISKSKKNGNFSSICGYLGIGLDGVNFLSSSWYTVMFWVQYEKNVNNTLIFSVVAK